MATFKILLSKKPTGNPSQVLSSARDRVAAGINSTVRNAHLEIVKPWNLAKDRPEFKTFMGVTPTGVVFVVEMDADPAEQATLSVWQLLDRGTAERPMHVSDDWVSKTAPGLLISGPGAGRKVGIFLPWMPGIRAREFALTVAEAAEPVMDYWVGKHYENELDTYFNG